MYLYSFGMPQTPERKETCDINEQQQICRTIATLYTDKIFKKIISSYKIIITFND